MAKQIQTGLANFPDGSTRAQRVYENSDGSQTSVTWEQADASAQIFRTVDGGLPEVVNAIFDLPASILVDSSPPDILSKVAFMDLAYANLGGSTVGITRYGEVIIAARASALPLVAASMERYDHATSFERDDVTEFLAILVANSIGGLTQAEADAITNNWPANGAA